MSSPKRTRDDAGVRAVEAVTRADLPPPAGGSAADGRWVRALAGEGSLAQEDHEALLSLALGEEVARVSVTELERAESLARALERGADRGAGGSTDDSLPTEPDEVRSLVELARAVRAANGRGTLAELSNERLLRRAFAQARPRRRETMRWASFGALAAAAAVALWWVAGPAWPPTEGGPARSNADAPGAAALAVREPVPARSTQPLFDPATRFPVRGGESERVDRIAAARATDLRANRYAMWGVP
jgi:hypothetical protein